MNSDISPGQGTGLEELEALSTIVKALQPLPDDMRHRVLASVVTLLGLSISHQRASPGTFGSDTMASLPETDPARFSEDRAPSPKEFLHEKRPRTDVDRVACLAYYLTHYRDTPHFKTLDISKLNTEAAQLKFSNAAYAVDNATKAGLLVPATKGAKQLSAAGERYVQALPDRSAAKAIATEARPRRTRRTGRTPKTQGRSES